MIKKSISFEFNNWQRAIKYKYGLHPLSTVGSYSFIGGRFNIGKSINGEVQSFGGLYIAKNKDTALQEHLGQENSKSKRRLSPREIALNSPQSETTVSISGNIDKIFDLRDLKNLTPFVKLIKNFVLPKELINMSKNLNEYQSIIKTNRMLLNTLLDKKWQRVPTNFDIPSNSQIFGHLVYMAGIEDIIYPSKFTRLPCLVIYPKNFSATGSYIALDDEVPHPCVPNRLDSSNWKLSELEQAEIINNYMQ